MTQQDEDDPDPEKITRGGLTKIDWKKKIVTKKLDHEDIDKQKCRAASTRSIA
jgi:hypothetical protein